jgi:hypothetical protein
MRYQNSSALCGPTAVANALEALGVDGVTQDIVAEYIASNTRKKSKPARDGTTQEELVKALAKWAIVSFTGQITTAHLASYTLRGALSWGSVAILGVDNTQTEGHWVAAFGMLGDRYIIADSAHDEIVMVLGEDELLARWCSTETKRGKQTTFFEIIIVEGKR